MKSYETTWLVVKPNYKFLYFAVYEFSKVAVLSRP